jgi:hypothetical protein
MAGLLIDDGGDAWPAQAKTIRNRFEAVRPQGDFLLQAISLGFAFVDVRGNGIKIGLHPQLVTAAALSRLYELIAYHDPLRVMVSVDPQLSSWELIASAIEAIKYIERRVAAAQRPSPKPLVVMRRLSLDELSAVWSGRMVAALHCWEAARSRWDSHNVLQLLTNVGLLGYAFIVRNGYRSERLVIDHWGADLTIYGRQWPKVARGRNQNEQPNADMAARFVAIARETIAEGIPRLDAIDCVFRDVDGVLVRRRGLRFAIPWQATNGDVWLSALLHWNRANVLERPTN